MPSQSRVGPAEPEITHIPVSKKMSIYYCNPLRIWGYLLAEWTNKLCTLTWHPYGYGLGVSRCFQAPEITIISKSSKLGMWGKQPEWRKTSLWLFCFFIKNKDISQKPLCQLSLLFHRPELCHMSLWLLGRMRDKCLHRGQWPAGGRAHLPRDQGCLPSTWTKAGVYNCGVYNTDYIILGKVQIQWSRCIYSDMKKWQRSSIQKEQTVKQYIWYPHLCYKINTYMFIQVHICI